MMFKIFEYILLLGHDSLRLDDSHGHPSILRLDPFQFCLSDNHIHGFEG